MASQAAQIRLAGVLWVIPGLILSTLGIEWLWGHSSGGLRWVLLAAGVGIGLAKGRFVLRKTARRILGAIGGLGSDARLGAFLGWKSLMLIGLMIGMGRLLRMSPIPREYLGAAYLGIGLALLLASLNFWRADSN